MNLSIHFFNDETLVFRLDSTRGYILSITIVSSIRYSFFFALFYDSYVNNLGSGDGCLPDFVHKIFNP